MAYSKQNWNNSDPNTPLSASRLNHIENGIADVDDAVDDLATVAETGDYNDLTGKPVLSLVAVSGSYNDLSDKPTLSTVASSGQYSDLSNKPTLSTVANTGSYTDLADKPTASSLGAVASTRTVAGKPLSADVTLVKADVGLDNVDNTTDAAKPVSTATQTALDLKAPLASPTFTGTVAGVTKAHVGLGSVDNTSDMAKPISTATQTALNGKQNSGNYVVGSGVNNIVALTQAAYDALTPVSTTLYVING